MTASNRPKRAAQPGTRPGPPASHHASVGPAATHASAGWVSRGYQFSDTAELKKILSSPRESAPDGPVSIGIDIVTVASVAKALERFGERYVRRNFTTDEAAYCCGGVTSLAASRLAARFAAKEATIKALRPERELPDWREIEVRRASSGACALFLHGEAASLAAQRGFHDFALSLCHEGDLAIAIVIAVGGRQGEPQAQHG